MSARPRVLIVEDNADVRRLYAIGLNQHGFEVKLAANGAEAVDRIENEKPDLILLDLGMPIMDGWELIDKINPSEQATFIPVVVVTGQLNSNDHQRHRCILGWLAKPAAIEQIVTLLNQALPPGRGPLVPANGSSGANRQTTAS
jgi:CheY-like chemotaxis protein